MDSIKNFIIKMANVSTRRNMTRPFTVIVEGNIGCGKTTFLNYFNKHNDVCVLAEPIELWRNCNGHNLFALMYEDPKKWSFTFQSYVQLTMLKQHAQKTCHSVKLMERSIYSARYCFVEKMTRDDLLPKPSASVIDEWFKWVTKDTTTDVDLIVYLRSSPEVAYERILKRNRAEEKSISFNYLKDLHEIHEDWLYYKTLHHCPAPVIILNADKDKAVIEEEYIKCESQILQNIAVQT